MGIIEINKLNSCMLTVSFEYLPASGGKARLEIGTRAGFDGEAAILACDVRAITATGDFPQKVIDVVRRL